MYGWIHGALEDWVQTTYGIEVWQSIVKISQCEVPAEGFFRNVHYSDEGLFQLVRASSVILNLDCDQIIFAAGQQFIHYLERHGYSRTLRCQGSTFLEWLRNVNEPHRLLRSRFPKAMFPVLWAEEDTEYLNKEGPSMNTVIMHYLSKRKDVFVPLFKGILTEAANYYFNIDISMEFLADEVISSNPEFPEYHARFRLFLGGENTSLPASVAEDVSMVEVSEATGQCPFHASKPTPTRELSSSVVKDTPLTLNSDKAYINSSSNVDSVGVSGSIFQHLFPFHLVLDHSLNIIQMGNKLQELIEKKWQVPNVLNHPINENFEIVTPKFIDWTWTMLQKLDKAPIEIALRTPLQKATNSHGCGSMEDNVNNDTNNNDVYPETITLRFRGEVILLDGKNADKIVLCVNPDIPHIDYLYQLHMRLADLPCHSYQAELLLIDEHLKTETNYSLSLKEIGAELDRETKRATKALELKRHFVRYVSHEIRTPLNIAILGLRFMEYAMAQQQQQGTPVAVASQNTARITTGGEKEEEEEEEEEDDESLPAVMNEVKSAVVIAVEILNDLLLYEKVDNSGFFELSPEFYDVHALVHESVSLFRVQAKGADVKFQVDDSLIVRAENDGTTTLPCRLGNDFHHHFKKSPLSLSSALSTSMTIQQRQHHHHPPRESLPDAKEKEDELESIIVKVDKSKTQQVLRNLFTNAVKFTSPGKSVKISYAVFGTPELLDAFHAEQEQKALAQQLQEEERQRRLTSAASQSLEASPRLMTEHSPAVSSGPYEVDKAPKEGNDDAAAHAMHPLMANQGLSSKSTRSIASLASRPSVAPSSEGGSLKESSVMSKEDTAQGEQHVNNKEDTEKKENVVVHFAEDFPDFPPYFVRIAVKDEGVGISDADQRTLFHEFIQLKAEKLQNGQGSGLGLWIASTIMHLHGGRIGVMSAGEGKGATFFIDLPIVVFEEEDDEQEDVVVNDPNHTLPRVMGEADNDAKTETELVQQIMKRTPLPPAIITSGMREDKNDQEDAEEAVDAFSIDGSDDIFRSGSHASNNTSKTPFLPGLTVNTHVFRSPPISPAYHTPNNSFFTGHSGGGSSNSGNNSNNSSIYNVNSSQPTPQNAALSTSHSRSRSGSTPPHYNSSQQFSTSPRWMGGRQPHLPSSASKYMLTMRTPRNLLPVYNNGVYNNNTHMRYPLVHPCMETVRVLIVDDAASNRKMVKRLFQTKFKHLEDAENGKVAVEKYILSLANCSQSLSRVSSSSHDQSANIIQEPELTITATSPHNVAAGQTENNLTKDNTFTSDNDTSKPPYGLILMDYLMPVMDGIEATRLIKQAAREHNVDVLVFGVTGQGLTEDVHLFKAVGADEVFMKPLDFTKLLACLQTTYHFS